MSLPVRQQRVMTEIEDALRASEPRLASKFELFTRLSQHEPITAEPLAGTRRRLAPADAMFAVVLIPVMLMLVVLGVLLGGAHSAAGCDVGYAAAGQARSATPRAESAVQQLAVARFVTRTASEQALSPSSTTTATSGVC